MILRGSQERQNGLCSVFSCVRLCSGSSGSGMAKPRFIQVINFCKSFATTMVHSTHVRDMPTRGLGLFIVMHHKRKGYKYTAS